MDDSKEPSGPKKKTKKTKVPMVLIPGVPCTECKSKNTKYLAEGIWECKDCDNVWEDE